MFPRPQDAANKVYETRSLKALHNLYFTLLREDQDKAKHQLQHPAKTPTKTPAKTPAKQHSDPSHRDERSHIFNNPNTPSDNLSDNPPNRPDSKLLVIANKFGGKKNLNNNLAGNYHHRKCRRKGKHYRRGKENKLEAAEYVDMDSKLNELDMAQQRDTRYHDSLLHVLLTRVSDICIHITSHHHLSRSLYMCISLCLCVSVCVRVCVCIAGTHMGRRETGT